MEDTTENKIDYGKKLEKMGRKSNPILYSTEALDIDNDPNIICKELRDEEDISEDNKKAEKPEYTSVFILKYAIDQLPQEVILGKMKKVDNRADKARKVIGYLSEQLKLNIKGKNNLEQITRLSEYIKENRVPFFLTMEGSDIIICMDEEKHEIRRTVYEDETSMRGSSLKSLYTKEERDSMKLERMTQREWKKKREFILKKLSEKKGGKELFLQGEEITKVLYKMQKDTKEMIVGQRRNIIADFIISNYGSELFHEKSKMLGVDIDEYIKLKEQGITTDSKDVLEKVQDKCYDILKSKRKRC